MRKKISCLILALLLFASANLSVYALSINGEGQGISGASSTSSGAYSIQSTQYALGFRFALVDEDGQSVAVTKNVYSSTRVKSWIKSDTYTGRFKNAYNKVALLENLTSCGWRLADAFDETDLVVCVGAEEGTAVDDFYNTYNVSDSSLELTLPDAPEDMIDWAAEFETLPMLLRKLWDISILELTDNNWNVIIEPIFYVKIGGMHMALTVTEIGIMAVANGMGYTGLTGTEYWNKVPAASNDSTTWRYIANYTHAEYPMSLRLSSSLYGIAGGSSLKTLSKANKVLASSKELITGGYGMMVLLPGESNSAAYTVNHYRLNASGSYALYDSEYGFAEAGAKLTLANLAKDYDGYKYSHGKVGSSTVTTTTVLEDGSRVINLYYKAQYTVKYDGNGATGGTMANSTHTIGEAQNLTANAFTKTGYTFTGWNTKADGSGTAYADKASVKNLTTTPGGTVTLYARWTTTSVKYVVNHFKMNTAGSYPSSPTETETKTGTTGATVTLANLAKSYPGFTYSYGKAGSATATTATVAADGSLVINLYYKQNTLTVIYHSNGATKIQNAGETITEDELTNNLKNTYYYSGSYSTGLRDGSNSAGLLLTKTGHTFTKYWLVGSASSTKKVSQSLGGTGQELAEALGTTLADGSKTVHVYAEWTENTLTVVYHSNGATSLKFAGTAITESQLVNDYTSVFKYSTTRSDGLRNGNSADYLLLTKTGYTFTGNWLVGSASSSTKIHQAVGGTGQELAEALGTTLEDGSKTIHVYAEWSENTLSVVYHSNGATKIQYNGAAITEATLNGSSYTNKYTYSGSYSYGLRDANSTSGLLLTKTGYTYTGYWLSGSATSSIKVSQSLAGTGQELAEALGTTLEDGSKTVHVYAEWSENTLTVVYHSNGATKIQNAGETITEDKLTNNLKNTYYYSGSYSTGLRDGSNSAGLLLTKTGHTFTKHWLSGSATSSIKVSQSLSGTGQELAEALGITLADGSKTVHVYAEWSENTLTVVYHSNGADKLQFSGTAITESQLVNDYTSVFKYSTTRSDGLRNGNSADYLLLTKDGHVFTGYWLVGDASSTKKIHQAVGGTGQELAEAMGLTLANGSKTVHVYAEWSLAEVDDGPVIVAIDRWFTLSEAQAGAVTLAELMSTASAEDSAVGQYTDFAAGEGTFTSVDYNAADFTSFEASGSVTITYIAEDFGGNVAHKTVTVYIVDTSDVNVHPEGGYTTSKVRFVSYKFYRDAEGGFVGEDAGGLSAASRWVRDSAYVQTLTNALLNRKDATGWIVRPAYSFYFTHETVEAMKDAISATGPGSDLSAFYNEFLN